MKRLFFVAAMLVASGTAVWAGNNMSSQATVVAAQDADFKPIDVKELPGAVAMSVEKYYPEAEIKEAAVKEDESGTKTYRVVLRQQEGTEKTSSSRPKE
ncbi:hypothetical protein [uncultured Alistipes sp.]|uniref:hypothetical protein n=1 Tax=uncultured Alistipes sp. TaxID=538949 RepID=UPI00266B6A05|nr:hypothetical protein [uncultured Alistipes sp.]